MKAPVWVPLPLVLEIHEAQLRQHGGATGVRDMGLLESALARPVNAFAYGETDICALASLYGAGIIRNHPFVDGNKRTGFVLTELFLNANGLWLGASDEDAIATTLSLAGNLIGPEAFADWLRENTRAL
jgi:death-on-curing protein